MKRGTKVNKNTSKVNKFVNIANSAALAQFIKKRAKEKGYSMERLADAIGYSRGGLIKMMKTNSYKTDALLDLAKVLEIDYETLASVYQNSEIRKSGMVPREEMIKMAIRDDQRATGLGLFHENQVKSKLLNRDDQTELETLLQGISNLVYKMALDTREAKGLLEENKSELLLHMRFLYKRNLSLSDDDPPDEDDV